MTTSKSKLATPATDETTVYYTVKVEKVIGQIIQDDYSDEHPTRAAFMMVADYFAENATDGSNSFAFVIDPEPNDKMSSDRRPIKITIED